MKNLNYIIENFKKTGLFEKIDEHKLNSLKNYDIFYSLRFDSFGMRIFAYLNCLRIAKKLEKEVEVVQLDERPEIPGSPTVKRPKLEKRKRSFMQRKTLSDYKNDTTERGLKEAKKKSVQEAEKPNKGLKDI